MEDTQYLLSVDFVQSSLIASALLGILSGVMTSLIVLRQMSFSVHATSELALMGASAALLFGLNLGFGAVAGAIVAAIILAAVAILWRPMLFASADPVMAQAAGVPTRFISVAFAVLVGLAAAQSVQIVGSLLVMALLITPGAAAVQITSSPLRAVMWATIFAEVSAVGGFVLSLAPGLPVSVFVTTISFVIYLVCRLIGWQRNKKAVRDEVAARRFHADCHSTAEEHHAD